ncbi:P22-like antirepressor protein [Azomonas agilis]|uniref:P22-like antirepressor protein n=1 Tax=Azomonas agilis TaxID=116849 RepID=A0A562HYV8_9GAMM|nr:phage antirepressor N-terminal domain-containing protein [Azomonas agilis]TWH63852.1 P22-like antirepressor protein [Azomonas agilis]
MNSNTQLATVEFHGQALTVITSQKGEHLVAMKPICTAIGLDWKSQYNRIQRNQVLKEGMVIMTTPSEGGEQETLCLPLDYLNGWLFGVDTNRVKPEIRPRLIQYQRECFHVLAAYFQQGEATNPRKPKKPKALPGALTEEQQSIIRALVKNHLETLPKEKQGAAARKCWGSLSKSFACKSYKDIPAEQFSEAVSLLSRRFLEGEFLGKAPTDTTLDELDLAMLYVFCIDTLELIHVGEEVKPIFDVLRPVKLINVPTCLSECREVVAHLHERFGPQMEQAARNRGAFDGRRNLAAAGDPSQPIWIPRRAQNIRG